MNVEKEIGPCPITKRNVQLFNGYSVRQISELKGITVSAVQFRLRDGWSPEVILDYNEGDLIDLSPSELAKYESQKVFQNAHSDFKITFKKYIKNNKRKILMFINGEDVRDFSARHGLPVRTVKARIVTGYDSKKVVESVAETKKRRIEENTKRAKIAAENAKKLNPYPLQLDDSSAMAFLGIPPANSLVKILCA